MTDQDNLSVGEIARSVRRIEEALAEIRTEVRDRHHMLSNHVNTFLGPVAVHSTEIASQQRAIDRLDSEVKDVTKQAARVSGGFAILAVISSLIPWPWKA